ncbi:MAG: N-acetylmuramic acid 6-phosphate etherase, partial [Candidatus Korobacteraceae bacterium]
NEKLVERGISILMQAADTDRTKAARALKSAEGSVPVALIMLRAGVKKKEAQQRLKAAERNVRKAIR